VGISFLLVLLGAIVLSHTAPFPFLFDAASGGLSVWRIPPRAGAKAVYLTFDDGPNMSATPALLDMLRNKGVHASFFLIEEYVDDTSAPVVRRMFEEGHAVGLHSNDRWLMFKSAGEVERRLREAAKRIESFSGHPPCALFRPHAGWRSIALMRGLAKLRYRLVGWSWQTWDWCWFRKRTAERVAAQVLAHAAPGKILVIHDGHHRNPRADRRYAVEAAGIIIDGLRARGYEFAGLCDR
jgi:peptidoglycan/xylan/chitin deacetylase (PgdA/CDA1 family)